MKAAGYLFLILGFAAIVLGIGAVGLLGVSGPVAGVLGSILSITGFTFVIIGLVFVLVGRVLPGALAGLKRTGLPGRGTVVQVRPTSMSSGNQGRYVDLVMDIRLDNGEPRFQGKGRILLPVWEIAAVVGREFVVYVDPTDRSKVYVDRAVGVAPGMPGVSVHQHPGGPHVVVQAAGAPPLAATTEDAAGVAEVVVPTVADEDIDFGPPDDAAPPLEDATRRRAELRLLGKDGIATITRVVPGAITNADGTLYTVDMSVVVEGSAPFTLTHAEMVPPDHEHELVEGGTLKVKVDRGDTSRLMIDWD